MLSRALARNGFVGWTDRKSVVVMEGFQDGGGRRRRAVVYERTDPRGEHRTRMEFTEPDDVRGLRLLHVAPRGKPDEYWLRYPGDRRTRREAGNAAGYLHRDEIFFGTDGSYRDLELIVRILQWDEHAAHATAEDAPCGTATCTRVELVPVAPNEFPFTRYALWFGRDDLLLNRIDLYGSDAEQPKETITCDGWVLHGTVQSPHRCEIEHRPTQARVTISIEEVTYDSGLGEDLFTVSSLERDG